MTTGPVPIRRLLFLVGFMGSGKTTVGSLLAARLGWKFVDLDEQIEQHLGRSIPQIFAEHGEPYFRQVESALLEEVLAEAERTPTVAALGGGTIAQPHNLVRIRANGGVTVWLRCPLEELRRRCSTMTNRPMFRDPASFRALYHQRLAYYEQADFSVEAAGGSPAAVVDSILALAVF
ncbi:MAG: shikimate kinase [Terriglobia bacterium]